MLTEKEKVTLDEQFSSKLEKGEIDSVECNRLDHFWETYCNFQYE